MKKKREENGFSLIELLVVILIVGIVSVIAIPNLMAARRSANEGSATMSMRTIHEAQTTFMSSNQRFANDLFELGSAGLIDETLSTISGTYIVKNHYNFVHNRRPATATNAEQYDGTAFPTVSDGLGATGLRSFYMNEQGTAYHLAGGTPPSGATPTNRVPTTGVPLE